MDQLRGIITVLNTPFTDTDSIDVVGLRRNVDQAIEAGVAGLLVPAMASEVDCLRSKERRQIIRTVVETAANRAIVIGGAAAPTHRETMQRAEEAIRLGCDGILVPLANQHNVHTTELALNEIASLEPGFLMLQDWDSQGTGAPLGTIVHLFERIEAFTWLKIEVQQAGPKYSQVIDATDGRLHVAGGWAVTEMIDGLERGVDAFMPTAMHRIYVEIDRRFHRGDRDGAVDLFSQIQPVLDFSNQSLEVSIRFFKQMLYRQNVYATPRVRIKAAEFRPDQVALADHLIDAVTRIKI